MSSKKARIFLALASTLVGLALCEAGLRLFSHFGAGRPPALWPGSGDALGYVAKLAAAPGTDRQWFSLDLPPLPNRSPVSRQREDRYRDFERRGLFGPQADYVWNRRFVESERCNPNGFFENYPDKVLVFDPPGGASRPRFRFPPSTTTFAGLVTNEFGLRGRPITLRKPPKTVRIAFLGASTTLNSHSYAFSYPERVAFWLNRFAASNRWDVSFEALNAGREGLNSEDAELILRDELLPLDPDLAVYYEGANQFTAADWMAFPYVPARKQIDPRDRIAAHKLPEFIRTHLVLGNLIDRALNGFSSVGEPRKPAHVLRWPAGVDESAPNPGDPRLPLQLPVIVKSLDSIRSSLDSIGGRLVLCSFEWLVWDGMPLSPTRHQYVYEQLNTVMWPLRYSEIRRMADFQNRVFRRYAEARGIDFLDVAGLLPQDPNLFTDAIHMTETGERLKAWVVFQQLAPIVGRLIESGRLPHATDPGRLPAPPSLATSEMSMRCEEPPPDNLVRVEGAVSFAAMRTFHEHQADTRPGPPLEITTGRQMGGYAAAFHIRMPAGLTGQPFLFLRARVLEGQIGFGVLDEKSDKFQFQRNVAPSSGMKHVYLPVSNPERADTLMIRNAAGGVRSKVLIEDVALMVPPKP